MKTPSSARSRRPATCLLIAVLILAVGAVSVQAQLTSFPILIMGATQDQATSVTSPDYSMYLGQLWLNPTPGQNVALPALVDFFSAQTSTVTAPIGPEFYFSGANYSGQTAGGDGGFYISIQVFLGSSPPPAPSLSSTLHGGVVDGVVTTINFALASLPSRPLFSADTFNTVTGTGPTGVVSVDASAFSVPGGATFSGRTFRLNHLVGGANSTFANLIEQSTEAGVTTFNLDTSLTPLVAGDPYQLSLTDFYFTGGIEYLAGTSLLFTAVPEPSTYAAIFGALALAGVMLHRRRRTV